MAATAVYAQLIHVPQNQGASREAIKYNNIAATTGAFYVFGGMYAITVVGSTFGSVTLQVLGGDGSTWLTAATAIVANGVALVDLPNGSYRFAIA